MVGDGGVTMPLMAVGWLNHDMFSNAVIKYGCLYVLNHITRCMFSRINKILSKDEVLVSEWLKTFLKVQTTNSYYTKSIY